MGALWLLLVFVSGVFLLVVLPVAGALAIAFFASNTEASVPGLRCKGDSQCALKSH
jgi:hypothetical protein